MHSILGFYVETQIGRKPRNDFSYMSWGITFIGSTNFLCFPSTTRRRIQLLDILSLMSTIDVMICCYDELSLWFTIDEIVIDVNSISVTRKCQTVYRDRKHKIKRRSKQYAEIKAQNWKRKLKRRSEQYAEIKAQNQKRKLRRRSE